MAFIEPLGYAFWWGIWWATILYQPILIQFIITQTSLNQRKHFILTR